MNALDTLERVLNQARSDPAITSLSDHDRHGAQAYFRTYETVTRRSPRVFAWLRRREVWNDLDYFGSLTSSQRKAAKIAEGVIKDHAK